MAHAGGRPKIQLDYEMIKKLAYIQCTQEEIANFLDVSVRTLQRDEEFCRLYEKGMNEGKSSLRRIQFKLAEKNTAMAIWLGKQYLGQREIIENNITAGDAEFNKSLAELLRKNEE